MRAVAAEFGDMPLEAAQDPDAKGTFLEWRNKLTRDGKPSAAEHNIAYLARVLSWGLENRKIKFNPLSTWKRTHKADRSDKIYSWAQIEEFAAVASSQMRQALYLAIFTGQRQADLRAFTWAHYANGCLNIRQGKSGRRVAVRCVEPLRAMLDAMKADGRTSTHILTTAAGQPWLKRNFSTHFRDTCVAAGIPVARSKGDTEGLTFHDLRGTTVVRLAEAGCTPHEIATWTGHKPTSVVQILEHYWVPTDRQGDSATAKLGNLIRTDFANRLQTVPVSVSQEGH